MKENVAGAEIKNEEIIHPLESPISPVGGLSILYGNIAQDGAVIKVGGVDSSVKPSVVRLSVVIHRMKPLN